MCGAEEKLASLNIAGNRCLESKSSQNKQSRNGKPVVAVIPTTCTSHVKVKDMNNNTVADALEQMKNLEKTLNIEHTALNGSPINLRRKSLPLETVAEMSESEDNSQQNDEPSSNKIQQLIARFQKKIENEATRSRAAKHFYHSDSENSETPTQGLVDVGQRLPVEVQDSAGENPEPDTDIDYITDTSKVIEQISGLNTSSHSYYNLLVRTDSAAKLTCAEYPPALTAIKAQGDLDHKPTAEESRKSKKLTSCHKTSRKPSSLSLNKTQQHSQLEFREVDEAIKLSTESDTSFPSPPNQDMLVFPSSPTISTKPNTITNNYQEQHRQQSK